MQLAKLKRVFNVYYFKPKLIFQILLLLICSPFYLIPNNNMFFMLYISQKYFNFLISYKLHNLDGVRDL